MDKNVNGSLLIIGNGFDKNCGLSSSFSDYFKTINSDSNLWYLLFRFAFMEETTREGIPIIERIKKNDILWMDVEDFIKRILYMHREGENKKRSLYNAFQCSNYCGVLELAFKHRHHHTYLYENHQFSEIRNTFERIEGRLNIDSFDIYSFLYDELISFENDFKAYIKKISYNNGDYLNKSSHILKELIGQNEAFDILTFNYTTPDIAAINFFAYGNINHIHGDLDTEIIIGFDSNDLNNNVIDKRLKMSKAWQKMFTNLGTSFLPTTSQILSLKMYGHSLGEQDYSYFYSLFDYYDIYNSKVVLEFFYTPYKDTDEENEIVKSEYIDAIYKLLNKYVSKTENANRGNIVVNKLILENRLKILPIKKYS